MHSRWVMSTSCLLAGLALVLGVTTGRAQNEQALINELIRKAEAGEPTSGFCATTKWPPGDSLETFTAHLNAASVGSWKVNTFATGGCSLDRVIRIHTENGGKCVTYKTWTCSAQDCGVIPQTIDCLDTRGVFVERRER